MKQPTYKGRELLPLSVIDAAKSGNADAIDCMKNDVSLCKSKIFCDRAFYFVSISWGTLHVAGNLYFLCFGMADKNVNSESESFPNNCEPSKSKMNPQQKENQKV